MLILLGMAGAGKSTQCRLLMDSDGYQWFSVGRYLRSFEKGKPRAEMMLGKVLDDSIVTPLVEKQLVLMGDNPEILLDGCPRTINQAKWLAAAETTPAVRCVVHILISDEVAMRRLIARNREDDSESAMKRRFMGYHRDIDLVIKEFTNVGISLIEIDGDAQQSAVHSEIRSKLAKL